ncbi:MAG: GNAT family N-acetyltransferase [Planctomycetes bacterium]|nr:GNAT family N-acetyltransferase [Planctomycetota bacterium]
MSAAAHVRPLRRTDLARLAELRLWYLAETARLEPRLKLVPEARERLAAACSVWWGQEERVTLVVEDPAPVVPAGEDPPVVGYATGLVSVWPPIWRAQRVGEIAETFVVPDRRRHGLGRALLSAVVEALSRRGVDVLRAPIPARNDGSLGLSRALGFEPVLRVLERPSPPSDGSR